MHHPIYHRRLLLATIIAGLFHGTAVAEDVDIPSIDVTATPVETKTLNTSVVTLEEIKSLAPATSDTASLLRNSPGVNIQKSGGVSGLPVMHGMADDRLRIKVNGMDLISACGNHMNPALSYISPTNVGSAIITPGLSPVSSGGDSIGGTILIDSPAPQFAKAGDELLTAGEAGGFYRSNGDVRGGNVALMAANEMFSINYQGSTVKSNNYDAGDDFKPDNLAPTLGRSSLDGDEVGSTFYKSTNQSIGLAMKYENHLLEFTYGEQDIPYQAWVNQRMDMTGNDSEQYNLNYNGEYEWGNLEARAYKERTRHKMQFDDDKQFYYKTGDPCLSGPTGGKTGCAEGMPMDTRGKNTGGLVKADIPLSSQDMLKIGAELQNYTLDDWWDPSGRGMWPDTFDNINNGQRDRTALFAEWESEWNPQWQTMLGIRGEQVDMDADEVQGYSMSPTGNYYAEATAFNASDRDITDHNIDVTALAQYTLDEMTDIEFGYAQKTRSPNLYERYTWSTHGMSMRMINWAGDGNGYVGNLELDPEIAHTISGTFDFHDANQSEWGLQVTPYYTYIDDYIDAARCSDGLMESSSCNTANTTGSDKFVYLQFVNQDAHIYGVDISGFYPLAKHTDYGSFTATGILNYTYGKNEDTHDYLYNMMPLNAKLAVVQNMGKWTNTVEWEIVDSKDNVSETRNEMETAGYGLLNLRSSYEWKDIRIDVGVENVFDKLYDDPLGGAYMGEGQTMSGTGVDWGLAVPGMGRSVYAGFNYSF